jgi:DNA repair exonuclease SbcCD ATPase subunit
MQAAINKLLGTDYEIYVRTVILSHESASSFLNSTPTQRHNLIEASLGLSMLDQCRQVSRLLLKDINVDMNKVEGKLEGLTQTMEYNERRLEDLDQILKRLKDKAEEAIASLEVAIQDYISKGT